MTAFLSTPDCARGSRLILFGSALLGAALLMAPFAYAELVLTSMFPTACQQGETVEVEIVGKGFENGGSCLFSRPGVTCEHLEKNRYRVTVAADAPLGDCDFWIATPEGLAGPRRFTVTRQRSVREVESDEGRADNDTRSRAQEVVIPCLIEARMDKRADVDWFRFHVDAGVALVIAAKSSSLDGSVLPALTFCGPDGREVAFASARDAEPVLSVRAPEAGIYSVGVHERAYRQDAHSQYRLEVTTGPRLASVFPHAVDAESAAELQAILYPVSDSSGVASDATPEAAPRHPVEAFAGATERGQLLRAPLPETLELAVNGSVDAPRRVVLRLDEIDGDARVSVSPQPVLAIPPGVSFENAAVMQPPARAAGRLLRRNALHWYAFEASENAKYSIDTVGERFGQWMDLDVTVCDSEGKPLATAPDVAAVKGAPASLSFATLDAALEWTAPKAGRYLLAVRDLYGGSVWGPTRRYELVVKPLSASFQVFALTEKAGQGVSIKRGETGQFTLVAKRSGGFQDKITVRAPEESSDGDGAETGGNSGLRIDPVEIDAKKVTQPLKIQVSETASPGFHWVRLVATATMGSDKEAAPAPVSVVSAATVRSGVVRRVRGVLVYVQP